MVVEELDKVVEKIKRLASGGNDTDMVCFIVAFDLLYFLNDTDNRNKFVYNYYKNDNSMFSANLKKVCIFAESIILEDEIYQKMLKNIEMEVRRDQLVTAYTVIREKTKWQTSVYFQESSPRETSILETTLEHSNSS